MAHGTDAFATHLDDQDPVLGTFVHRIAPGHRPDHCQGRCPHHSTPLLLVHRAQVRWTRDEPMQLATDAQVDQAGDRGRDIGGSREVRWDPAHGRCRIGRADGLGRIDHLFFHEPRHGRRGARRRRRRRCRGARWRPRRRSWRCIGTRPAHARQGCPRADVQIRMQRGHRRHRRTYTTQHARPQRRHEVTCTGPPAAAAVCSCLLAIGRARCVRNPLTQRSKSSRRPTPPSTRTRTLGAW